jgi:hypothetical protein
MTFTQEPPDRQLLGVWRGAFDEDAGGHYFHFLEQDDGSIAGIWVALPCDGKKGGWLTFSLRTAVRSGQAIATIRWRAFNGDTTESEAASAVFRVLYRIHGGRLSAYLENRAAAAAALSVGRAETAHDIERSRSRSPEPAGAPGATSAPQGRTVLGAPLIVLTRVE